MSKSTQLLDDVIARIKATGKGRDGKPYFREVKEYGGEFTSAEIKFDSFVAPAAFVSCLGWQPDSNPKTLSGDVERIRMVVFIVTKFPKRAARFRASMQRAELLTGIFRKWKPKGLSKPVSLKAENLFNRGSDQKGMALWMLSWWHEIGFDDTTAPTIEDFPDFKGMDGQSEGHVPPVSGDDAPEDDLKFGTKINLEKSDEQGQNGNEG